MNELCIRDLVDIVGGELRLGTMPPLAGDLEPLRAIKTDYRDVGECDLFWPIQDGSPGGAYFAEDAYLRGALGAVVAGRMLEPWAGTFSIEVDDSNAAMQRLGEAMRCRFGGRVANLYSDQATTLTRICETLLQSQLTGSSHVTALDRPAMTSLALAHVLATDDFTLLAQSFSKICQEDQISHLSCPHVAVITRTAMTEVSPSAAKEHVLSLARSVLQGLPDNGLMIVSASDAVLQDAARAANVRVVHVANDCERSPIKNWRRTANTISFEIDDVSFHVPNSLDIRWETVAAALTLGRELGISPLSMQTVWQFFQQLRTTKQTFPTAAISVDHETQPRVVTAHTR